MTKFALLAVVALTLSAVDATTRVAIIELGKGGVVRRTNARDPLTTASGVASLWSALHSPGRKLQHAGMTVVPDLFNKANEGLVVGLKGSGMDLDAMPFVNGLLSEEGNFGVVGHMEVSGNGCDAMMKKLGGVESVDVRSFSTFAKKNAFSPELTGMVTNVEASDSVSIDGQISELIKSLDHEATAEGKTVVLHLVVEEEEGSARRRLLSRRLEEGGQGGGQQGQGGNQNNNGEEGQGEQGNQNGNNQNNNNNNGDQSQQQNNGYYGYGYYNSYGEWVSTFAKVATTMRFDCPLFFISPALNSLFAYFIVGHPVQDHVSNSIL